MRQSYKNKRSARSRRRVARSMFIWGRKHLGSGNYSLVHSNVFNPSKY